MDKKKQIIIQTAAAMFLDKGFQQTSTQDIAEACNMSKTTLYKYFDKKEDLGLQVAYHLSWSLLYSMEKYQGRNDLTPKQKLRGCLILRMEHFQDKHRFMDALLSAFSLEQKDKYTPAIYKLNFQVFNAFLQLVTAAFEMKSEPAAWEITLGLNGMMRGLSFLPNKTGVTIDKERAADYIMDSLEGMTKARLGKPPLLDKEQLKLIVPAFMQNQTIVFPNLRRNQILQALRDRAADFNSPDKENCLEVIGQLEAEYQKSLPKPSLAEAFLAYLAQWSKLEEPVSWLRELEK